MTSTTYIARYDATTPVTDAFARTSGTMAYTHAVVVKAGACTWHLTEAAARKGADRTGARVVAVEAHQGGKATVLRRLAAEAGLGDPSLPSLGDPATTPVEFGGDLVGQRETPVPAATGARTWDATTTTSHVCAGACGQELPATSYPTTGKPGLRGVVCRKDRDAARAARGQ